MLRFSKYNKKKNIELIIIIVGIKKHRIKQKSLPKI